jgi:WD40 repeat protein
VVRIWNPASGLRLLELPGHRGTVKRVAWTSEGRRLLSVGDDGLLHVWDADTGAELHALAGHGSWIEAVVAGPGALALTAGGDRTLRRWDTAAGKLQQTFSTQVPDLSALALSPDGKVAVSGAADGRLRTWDVETGALRQQRSVKTTALDLAFSPDGRWLASAQRGDTVRLWDPATLNLQRSLGR